MTVTSSSPSWRALSSAVAWRRAAAMASRLRASISTRNSVFESNIACASATGTIATSSAFMPRPWPAGAITPMTRSRRPPMRTVWPSAEPWPKSSRASAAPSTVTAWARPQSSSGRNCPCASASRRTAR